VVRRFGGKGQPPRNVEWDGKDETGLPMADGRYRYLLAVQDAQGRILSSSEALGRDLDQRPAGLGAGGAGPVMTRRPVRGRPPRGFVSRCPASISVMLAGVLRSPRPSRRGRSVARRRPAAPSLEELGRGFEAGRLLAGADRVSALQQTDASLTALLDHGIAADRRAAARFPVRGDPHPARRLQGGARVLPPGAR